MKKQVTEKIPLSDTIYKNLREEILSGELRPGQRLMEIHYAKKHGVSRTPFREAVRRLEQEGLVTVLPRRGAHVKQLSARDIAEVLEVRGALDALAATLCAHRMTKEDQNDLKSIETAFEKSVENQDIKGIIEGDITFHEYLYTASGNSLLVGLYKTIQDRIYRYRVLYIKDFSYFETITNEHRLILEAISKKDEHLAGEIALMHIKHQEQGVMKYIKKT